MGDGRSDGSVWKVRPAGLRRRCTKDQGAALPPRASGDTGDTGDSGDSGARVNARRTTRCSKRRQPPFNKKACASTPQICKNLRNLRFPIVLCVSSWFFVFFVIAAQRSASSPPGAADRASTSGAPPSFQASKLPSFLKKVLAIGVGDLLTLMGFVWGCSVPRRRGLRGGYSSLLSRGGPA